jgi:NAD(P)H-dependent FMN reductase
MEGSFRHADQRVLLGDHIQRRRAYLGDDAWRNETSAMSVPREQKHFLFILASARREGNAELLARQAASALPRDGEQTCIRLSELPLPLFEDVRHSGPGTYPYPQGHLRTLLEATLKCTDLVFVAPLYWYGLPATAKLYLDHWSSWLRVAGINFKERMAGKTLWAISSYSGEDPATAAPLFETLRLTTEYMHMRWGGGVLGSGNRPADVMNDAEALRVAFRLFEGDRPESPIMV